MQMGLRINGGGGGLDTSLGDTLAAALFGDPDQARKDALAQSQLQNDAYNRAQSLAAAQYQEQLTRAADEKAYRDQEIHRARIERGKVYGREQYDAQFLGDDGAPVPVELPDVPPPPVLPQMSPVQIDPGTDPAIVYSPTLGDGEQLLDAPVAVELGDGPLQPRGLRIGPEIAPSLVPPIQFNPAQVADPAQDPGVTNLLRPGEVKQHEDGSVTVGTEEGNAHLSREEAEAIGIVTSLNEGDTSQANQREAGTAALLYNPNLTLTPTERVATLAGGGSAISKDSAASQDGSGGPAFNKDELDLRTKYEARPEFKRYDMVKSGFKNLLAGAAQNTGFGDNNMIYAYVKMVDPGSTVGVGDTINLQNAPGVSSDLANKLNNLLTMQGRKFDEQGIKDFTAAARSIYMNEAATFEGLNKYYANIATANGLRPENVIYPIEQFDIPADQSQPQAALTLAQARGEEPIILPDGTEDTHLMSQAQWDAWKAAHPVGGQ